MHEHVLSELDLRNLSARAGLRRPANSPRPPRRGLLLGFDTEWQSTSGDLLSVQFAALVGDRRVSAVYDPRARKLSTEKLVALVERFVRNNKLEVPKKGTIDVYLVAHFAVAELGTFEDPLRDAEIDTLGKAHFAKFPELTCRGRKWRIRIVDLYAIYAMSLKKIGDAIDLPKIELAPGQIEDLESLRRNDRETFDAYAARDAEIAVAAMSRLRERLLADWNIDPLMYRTTPSIALAIFRYHFLDDAPVRSMLQVQPGGKSVHVVVDYRLRRLALRAYWGGRNEAYVRGVYRGPVLDLDVKSMYPHAAILQALPNTETRWKRLRFDERRKVSLGRTLVALEGFATVDFKFPRGCDRPCLPVTRPHVEKLFFPRSGRSHCTLAELRVAIDLGATFRIVELCGFDPGPLERDHSLARFVRRFIADKNASEPRTLEYETTKLILNALVGKFGERLVPDMTTKVERHGRLNGVPGLAQLFAGSAVMRGALKGAPRIGTGFAPEYAALIVGRSRAIMSAIVDRTKALLVSTDGVIVPAGTDVDAIPAVTELRSVGSDLEEKGAGDGVWIGRERLYAVLKRSPREKWEIDKLARHGMPGSDIEVAEDLLASLRLGADAFQVRIRKRLAKATEAAQQGLRVNQEVIERRKGAIKWDGKRRLMNRDVNVFAGFSRTEPYGSLGGVQKALIAAVHAEARRKVNRRRLARTKIDEASRLLRETEMTIREIAERTGISKSSVANLKQKLMRPGSVLLPTGSTVAVGRSGSAPANDAASNDESPIGGAPQNDENEDAAE